MCCWVVLGTRGKLWVMLGNQRKRKGTEVPRHRLAGNGGMMDINLGWELKSKRHYRKEALWLTLCLVSAKAALVSHWCLVVAEWWKQGRATTMMARAGGGQSQDSRWESGLELFHTAHYTEYCKAVGSWLVGRHCSGAAGCQLAVVRPCVVSRASVGGQLCCCWVSAGE